MIAVHPVVRYANKLMKMIRFATDLADLSKCKRSQVGCVIFPLDCSAVYALGYNGPGRNLSNESCTEEAKRCGCAHAEANALTKLSPNTCKRSLIYTTTMPCPYCAPLIVNANIFEGMIWGKTYDDILGLDIVKSSGMHTVHQAQVEFVANNEMMEAWGEEVEMIAAWMDRSKRA